MINKSIKEKEPKPMKNIGIQTIFISLFGIFLCFCALCSTSWAWFTDNTNSGNNIIASGSFELTTLVKDKNSNNSIEVKDRESCTIGAGEYIITISISDNSTATRGFCKIKIDNEEYVTKLIEGETEFIINVECKKNSVEIKVESVWGIPSTPNVDNRGSIIIE